jgi:curved DNA-binding protein CbpA
MNKDPKNYYALLNANRGDDAVAIKKAYKKAAL